MGWKKGKQRDLLFWSLLFLFQFLLQKKLVSEKFQQQISLWKKKLASHPEQSFFVKMENASSEDLSEVFQQQPSTEGSVILLLL